jgi:rRNA maturation RNase YbeY
VAVETGAVAVEIRCDATRGLRYARGLRSDAVRLMRALELDACELSLLIVSDRAMRNLNRRFGAKDRPTDVLSFAQLEENSGDEHRSNGVPSAQIARRRGLLLGDVVISVDTALRQARRLRVAPAARLRTLLIHGLLHLLGYDHERSAAEARRMFARERELAAQLPQAHRAAKRPIRSARR